MGAASSENGKSSCTAAEGVCYSGSTACLSPSHQRQSEASYAVNNHAATLEKEYWKWTNKRWLAYDFWVMVATLALSACSVCLAIFSDEHRDAVFLAGVSTLAALSSVSILAILMRTHWYWMYRNAVMSSLLYILPLSVWNHYPFLDRALQATRPLRAFLTICCHRWIGVFLSVIGWRLPVSWASSVSFNAMMVNALGAVRSSKVFAERDPDNAYVRALARGLNYGVHALCRAPAFLAGLAANGAEHSVAEEFPCEDLSARQTVLLVWLSFIGVSYWLGFHIALRSEETDRRAFLLATRRPASVRVRLQSAQAMVLHMLAVQMFAFALLLLFGDQLL